MHYETRHAKLEPVATAVAGILETAQGEFARSDREIMAWTEGFLTAAAIGPERTHPDEWARVLFGRRHKYADAEEAQASMATLALLYNAILADLRRLGPGYAPFFLEHAGDGEEVGLAELWAEGFMDGMRLRGHAWRQLIGSEQGKRSLAAIVAFLPEMRTLQVDGGKLAAAQRDALEWLGVSVHEISRYWKLRARCAQPASADVFPKTGRNDPCPCGSGKKYKKCCLGGMQ